MERLFITPPRTPQYELNRRNVKPNADKVQCRRRIEALHDHRAIKQQFDYLT